MNFQLTHGNDKYVLANPGTGQTELENVFGLIKQPVEEVNFKDDRAPSS
jgi:hypothetical protein